MGRLAVSEAEPRQGTDPSYWVRHDQWPADGRDAGETPFTSAMSGRAVTNNIRGATWSSTRIGPA
jgi:hypothetical protein